MLFKRGSEPEPSDSASAFSMAACRAARLAGVLIGVLGRIRIPLAGIAPSIRLCFDVPGLETSGADRGEGLGVLGRL